ncbi:O-antigen ligase family protein [Desmospora activa]|uniref:O-antigen ligase-like membrane protein n=1 Tax=Desmospora activa DSM 45169 TaxID=1121389 RepID=A0A2T4Z4B4_9BACL|nr:O-antigen ligase family protein [Desmospora activa]PTM56720.1 O-antigen ligase-like membrane protein [Desmospora activa DSM 45169]
MSSLLMPRQPRLHLLFHLMVAFALLGPTLGIPLPGLFNITFFRVAFILLAAGLLVHWVKNHTPAFGHFRPIRWFTAFTAFWFFYAAISLTWVANLPYGIRYITFLGTMLLLTLSFPLFIKGTDMLKQTVKVMFGVFAVIVVFGVFEALTFFHLPSSRYYGTDVSAVTSFFNNQNDLATAVNLALPFLAAAMVMLPLTRIGKVTVYITGILALSCLFITGSRSNSMFGLPLITVLWLGLIPFVLPRKQWWNRKNLFQGALLLTAAAVIVSGLTSTLLADHTRTKLSTSLGIVQDLKGSWTPFSGEQTVEPEIDEPPSGDKSVSIRKYLIANGLNFLVESHFLGVGAGNVEHYMAGAPGVEDKTNIHNWWMEVLVNFGLLIFILYMGFYLWIFWKLWCLASVRRTPELSPWIRWGAVSCMIALAGYSIGGMAPSTAIHFTPMWVVHGFALAVIVLGKGSDRTARIPNREGAR